jgi:uncharacterized protein involved in exopolysaccharide biosynthesis
MRVMNKAESDAKIRDLNGELAVVARAILGLLTQPEHDEQELAALDARRKELRRQIRQEEDRWIDMPDGHTPRWKPGG